MTNKFSEWGHGLYTLYHKFQSLPPSAKAAIGFTFGNLLLKGIGIFSAPLFARVMPKSEYGLLSVFMACQQMVLVMSTWDIPLGAYQKGIFKFRDRLQEYTTATYMLTNILTAICFLLIWIFYDTVYALTGMNSFVLTLLFLYLLVQPAYAAWMVRERTDNNYWHVVSVNIGNCIANILVPFIAILYVGKTAEVKYASSLIVSTLIALLFYIPYIDCSIVPRVWNRIKMYWSFSLRFEAPLLFCSLSYMLIGQSDRIMIGMMEGKTEAAYYSVAASVVSSIGIFQTSANQALIPWMYKKFESTCYEKIHHVSFTLFCIAGGIILFFELTTPEMVYILFTANYLESIWCIPPLALSMYFMLLSAVFINAESYYEETKYVMYVAVFCSALNIVLNYLMLPIFGYISCAYTSLFCSVVFTVGHYCFLAKILREKLQISISNMFRKRAICLHGLVMIVSSCIILALYSHPILRYVIVGVAVLCACWHRTTIIQVYNVLKRNDCT